MSPLPALAKTMSRRLAARDLRVDAIQILEIRSVGADPDRAVADRRGGLVELGLAPARDEDLRAAFRELARRREADAAAPSGDQRNLALQ
jgi:hypothetical protein